MRPKPKGAKYRGALLALVGEVRRLREVVLGGCYQWQMTSEWRIEN